MSDALLPCPFCGGEAQKSLHPKGYFLAHCRDAGCDPGHLTFAVPEKWNTRARGERSKVIASWIIGQDDMTAGAISLPSDAQIGDAVEFLRGTENVTWDNPKGISFKDCRWYGGRPIEQENAIVPLRAVRTQIAKMKPDERVRLFQRLIYGYCRHCGDPESEGNYCQCQNDE